MEEKKKGNKKMLFNVITFIVAFGLAFFVTTKLMSGNSVMAQAKAEIEKFNKKCPMKVDDMTRLDSVALLGKTANYYYTILMVKDSLPKDMSPIIAEVKAKTQQNFDTSPEMKIIRDNQFGLKYNYKDKNGIDLFDFSLKAKSKK